MVKVQSSTVKVQSITVKVQHRTETFFWRLLYVTTLSSADTPYIMEAELGLGLGLVFTIGYVRALNNKNEACALVTVSFSVF